MVVPRPEKIQFRGSHKDEFLTEVRKRVDAYFLETGSSKNAGMILHFKALALFSSLILFWSTLMFGWAPSIPRPLIWMLFGINQGLLAMNVGHDALHGSYSKSPTINQFLGYFSYDLVGLSSYVWKQTHNHGHHTYTNIDGHDPDINKPGILRLSPHAPFYKGHRFQHFYIWVLYALVGINWVFYADYYNVWKDRKTITQKDLVPFLVFKAINLIMIIFLPLFLSPMGWPQVLVGYFCMQFAGGFTVSIIFQLAHIVENVEFPLPDENGVIPANWGVHEMRTTSNFATSSPLITHLFGGLNFQIEHHLMPKISHAHYRQISPIVKQTALEYDLPYHELPSLAAALSSHARLLKKFGINKPDSLNIENIP